MIAEIECPTCESMISISRHLKLGDKIECQLCAELLQVVCLTPLAVEYYGDADTEQEDDEEEFIESADVLYEMETKFKPPSRFEDEENQSFELPEKSTLFGNPDEEEEGQEKDEGETD